MYPFSFVLHSTARVYYAVIKNTQMFKNVAVLLKVGFFGRGWVFLLF